MKRTTVVLLNIGLGLIFLNALAPSYAKSKLIVENKDGSPIYCFAQFKRFRNFRVDEKKETGITFLEKDRNKVFTFGCSFDTECGADKNTILEHCRPIKQGVVGEGQKNTYVFSRGKLGERGNVSDLAGAASEE